MEISKAGNMTAEQMRGTAHQRPAEKPDQAAQEMAAQGSKIPDGTKGTQEGAVSQAKNETQQQAERDAAALQQAQSSVAASTEVTTTTTDDEDDAYQTIVQKADSGQTLTSAELSQLRAKDATRYSKALKAMEARQNLRSQMEKDPSHASKAAREAIAAVKAQDAATVGNAHGTGANASSVASALSDEYGSFARQYDQILFDSPAGEE
ncbi:hypothetical protein LJB76_03200 [Clostridia bacterium OttesenSCG-928-O13]|nr:hypothetical protein [Clostridia bacterium OttesenSCG-928-O13]